MDAAIEQAATMLDDSSSCTDELLESVLRTTGPGVAQDIDDLCTATVACTQETTGTSIIVFDWGKITWDDISCTEQEETIINKDDRTRLKTMLGLSPRKITTANLRAVCAAMHVDGWSRKTKYQMCELRSNSYLIMSNMVHLDNWRG